MNQKPNQKQSKKPYIIGDLSLFEEEVECCVTRCPNCKKRSRGEIGDTKRVTWRCKGCKHYNYGMIRDGEFILFVSCSFEVDLGKFVDMYKSM